MSLRGSVFFKTCLLMAIVNWVFCSEISLVHVCERPAMTLQGDCLTTVFWQADRSRLDSVFLRDCAELQADRPRPFGQTIPSMRSRSSSALLYWAFVKLQI